MADSAYFGAHGYDLCDVRLFHYLIRRTVPTLETGRAIFISTCILAVCLNSVHPGRCPSFISQILNRQHTSVLLYRVGDVTYMMASFSTRMSAIFFLV